MGVGVKSPFLKSDTHVLQWWNLAQSYLTYRRSKEYRIKWHTPWVLLTSGFFHQKSANFAISRNTDTECIVFIIFNSFNFFWVFKDCFNKHGYDFDDVRKMATPGLLKIKVFWDRVYGVYNLCPWRHQQNFITWFKLYYRCGHVTKVW